MEVKDERRRISEDVSLLAEKCQVWSEFNRLSIAWGTCKYKSYSTPTWMPTDCCRRKHWLQGQHTWFERFQRKLPPARPQVPPSQGRWGDSVYVRADCPWCSVCTSSPSASKTVSELPSDDLKAGSRACPAASHGSKCRARSVCFVKWMLSNCLMNRAVWTS